MIGSIYITGAIGHWEGEQSVVLTDIVKQVKDQPAATSFNVYINSEGGHVDVGFDIYNYLKSIGKPITTIGNSMVASIATVIFMAGSTRQVKDGTRFMIHLPWGEAVGNADEMEQYAKELRNAEKQLTEFYKKELNLEAEAIQPLLRDETWLTPEQLQTLGFVTMQPLMIAAKASINIKTPNKMTDEDKGFVKGLFDGLEKLFKPKPKAKLVQDATGTELDFTDLADDATVEVGAAATVAGAPAEGEYTLPDGSVYVFVTGVLTEIKPAEDTTDSAAKDARIAELEAEIVAAKAETTTATTALASIRKEVNTLKTQVFSKFQVDEKKEKPEKDKPEEESSYSQALAKARDKSKIRK